MLLCRCDPENQRVRQRLGSPGTLQLDGKGDGIRESSLAASIVARGTRTFVPLAVGHDVAIKHTATTLTIAGQGTGRDMAGASSDDLDGLFDWAVSLPSGLSQSYFAQAVPTTGSMDAPSFQLCLPAQVQGNQNTMYYQHYLFTVSTLLIIFDTPSNSNPYRMLLSLVGNENSTRLQSTMEALGAMHLASLPLTEKRSEHRAAAIKLYASVVSQLRKTLLLLDGRAASLELLAICLLLCMYEKMSATDASWKVHLRGASQIAQAMYSPGLTVANRNKSSALITLDNTGETILRQPQYIEHIH
ncbi:hypothetical protein MY1884_003726 [Beauveria asiatica]